MIIPISLFEAFMITATLIVLAYLTVLIKAMDLYVTDRIPGEWLYIVFVSPILWCALEEFFS